MNDPANALVARVAQACARIDYARLAARPQRKRRRKVHHEYPTEYQEGVQLAKWLYGQGIIYTHVANEGKRDPVRGAQQKALGVHAGVPDYLIFSPPCKCDMCGQPFDYSGSDLAPDQPLPPCECGGAYRICWAPGYDHQEPHGVAIELKRQHGGRLSDNQRKWLSLLRLCGWQTFEAAGEAAAVAILQRLGY